MTALPPPAMKTNAGSGTDDPRLALAADLPGLIDRFNEMRDYLGGLLGVDGVTETAKLVLGVGEMSPVGRAFLTLNAAPSPGFVMMDDGTIGNGASGASNRAHADTEGLFKLLWNGFTDTNSPVGGGRGANAQIDWDAGKTIQLLRVVGRGLAVPGLGAGMSVPRAQGDWLGEEAAILDINQMPLHGHGSGTLAASSGGAHTHTFDRISQSGEFYYSGITGGSGGNPPSSFAVSIDGAHSHTFSGSVDPAGGSDPVDLFQPTSFAFNVEVSLGAIL